jgi:hypothetical protein
MERLRDCAARLLRLCRPMSGKALPFRRRKKITAATPPFVEAEPPEIN